MRTLLGTAVLIIAVVGLAIAATEKTVVVIKDADGKSVGKATLSKAEPKGVKLDLDIQNLPPGEHAFHLHQKSVCDASEDFDTAGLQLDPTGEMYGNAEHHAHSGPSAGDPRTMVKVAEDGTGHVSVVFPNLTLGDDKNSVFANGGTAMVFHAAAGAKGPTRIACGTISRPK
jgi:superoxide dismutase, Cu-Zn family